MTLSNIPDPLPPGLARAGRRALHEIDERDEKHAEALAAAFLSAAWPSLRAQNQ